MTLNIIPAFERSAPSAENTAAKREAYPFLEKVSEDLLTALDTLRQSKTGRQLLEDAEKYGTKIGINSLNGAHGAYDDELNVVIINEGSKVGQMVETLAHELRHSQQFQNGVQLNALTDIPGDYIHSQRTIEADANVASCQVCWELQQQGNPEPMKAFASEKRKIADVFTASAEKGGIETGEAHAQAFYKWFDDADLLEAYERNYLRNFKIRERKASSQDMKTALRRSVPILDNIARICKFNGKQYLNPEEADAFFKKPEMNCVSHDTWWSIYRTTRDILKLDWSAPKEEIMAHAGGFTERCEHYSLSKYSRGTPDASDRRERGQDNMSRLRQDVMNRKNKSKNTLITAALIKKKNALQK